MDPRRSLKIVTIRGVDLKLHISLLILLFYVVIVASAQFPLVVKQLGLEEASLRGGPFVWSLIFAFALLLSVAIHEFGHVLVAQAQGVKVRGVTLMMLGGMSEMEEMPEKPYAEFKLAIIGPVVSFAIAGGLFFLRSQTTIPDLVLFSSWLGTINLVLAIFNLLPAFPLDGGRALRSVLAARQGTLRGTQTAVIISKALAWALGILGLLAFNVILILIAFFVYTAASSELFMLTTKKLLKGVLAGEVGMKTRSVDPSENIQTLAEEMIESRSAVLPVRTDHDDAPAVVRLSSLRAIPRDRWAYTNVRQVMERVPKRLAVHELISESLPTLAATPAGALPLTTSDGRIIGIVRSADVFELMQFQTLRSEIKPSVDSKGEEHDERHAA